jgi:hypothetical protein
LPLGWRKGHPDAKSTTPQGVDDETFIPGFDTVTYEVALPNATSALRVDVTVLYQTLGARYAAEILAYTTPEVNEFRGYYAKADKTPETIATASAAVEAR